MKAINSTRETIKNKIRVMEITKPMYTGDIANAIGFGGKIFVAKVIFVVEELVAEGVLKVAETKYGYNKYVKA